MRGEILEITGDGEAVVRGDDGVRYAFSTRDVQGFVAYRGDRIDFVPAGDVATEIFLLSSGPARSAPLGPSARPDDGETSPWGYFVRGMRKYVDGYGRARRSEYWFFVLFRALFVLAPAVLGFATGGILSDVDGPGPVGMFFFVVSGLIYLGTVIPNLCALIRRFHDVGLSGWLVLLNAIPYIGALITFIISVLPSEARSNTHGPIPGSTQRSTAEVFS